MKITQGGNVDILTKGKEKIERISISAAHKGEIAELWINESLSYLNINELLNLKREIDKALNNMIA